MSKTALPASWPVSQLFIWLALLLLPLSTTAASPEQIAPWLEKMRNAVQQDYDGEMVYLRDGRITSLGVVHRMGPNGPSDRLFALDGAPRELVRDINRVSCKLAPGQILELPLGSSAGNYRPDSEQLAAIGRQYQISLQQPERIANRETQPIELIPNGNQRYGHRLWLDTVTGLPLKTQLLDPGGQVLEQLMFTEIDFLDATNGDNDTNNGGDNRDSATDTPAPAVFNPSNWTVDHLPEGFSLTAKRRLTDGTGTSEHLIFSDGMATVSVFIEDLEPDSAFNGISRRGSVTLYGRTFADHQVTVIGEVPETTARRFGDGLRVSDD